jgi:Cu+-exporting ATPase
MADMVTDPVCGMPIRPQEAAASEEHDGQTFYFCSTGCRDTFLGDPHQYGQPHDR